MELTLDKEIMIYLRLKDSQKPKSEDFEKSVENKFVKSTLINLLCDMRLHYGREIHGLHGVIQNLENRKKEISEYLNENNLADITFLQLKDLNPYQYNKIVFYDLYTKIKANRELQIFRI